MKPKIFSPISEDGCYTRERCHITEIVNDPELEGVSLAKARVEPGVTTELHALSSDEIYFVLLGVGEVEVGGTKYEGGSTKYEVEGTKYKVRKLGRIEAGQAVLIPRGVPQRITNVGEVDLVFLCICAPRFREAGYEGVE